MFRLFQTTLAWAKSARGSNVLFAALALAGALGAPALWVGLVSAMLFVLLASD
ncbi:hypothetical protein [Rhodobacter lacus]|uniref:Uncharacterized protein n=1 Tax=Rhodobacter lacus TaxID=1641972 RepID=A0ABW5A651_9RHOB